MTEAELLLWLSDQAIYARAAAKGVSIYDKRFLIGMAEAYEITGLRIIRMLERTAPGSGTSGENISSENVSPDV